MFSSYFELGGRIRKHYFSPSVFFYLASGQFVPPIHRRNLYSLQYSMLPSERASFETLWAMLTEQDRTMIHKHDGSSGLQPDGGLANGNGRKFE